MPEAGLAFVAAAAVLHCVTTVFAAWRLRRMPGRFPGRVVVFAVGLMALPPLATWAYALREAAAAPGGTLGALGLAVSALFLLAVATALPRLLAYADAWQRQARLGHVLEGSLNEICVFDAASLRFLEVNRGARENLGYTMEELRALTPVDLKPEFTPEGFLELLAPLRCGARDVVRFETVHRRKDGSTYPVEVHLQLAREDGPPVFFAIILDLSERQRAEKALRRLEAAMDQAGEAIVVTGPRGRIVYANRAFDEMMGFAPGVQAIGTSIGDLSFGPADAKLLDELWTSVKRGDTWHGRYESAWPDGSRHVRDGSVAPVIGPDGEIQYVVSVLRDVTREVELEHHLLHAQKMEAIGRLAAGVAHDFNNLLTVIMGYASALHEHGAAASPEHSAAAEILAAGERASALTRQLLTVGRKTPVSPRPIDLGEVLGGMHGMLSRVIGEDVEVTIRIDAGIGRLDADPAQIEQAVLNLAANARDAMPGGGRLTLAAREVELRFGEAGGLPAGTWVVLSVSDTGTGMDRETLRRAFDPFFTTKEPGRGTGLGLAAVDAIVRSAGGMVRSKSEPERGSTFELWFPRSEPGGRGARGAQAARLAHAAPRSRAPLGRGETVLLVEDEPMLRAVAQRTLEARGYRVVTAQDAADALARHEELGGDFDLLLTDVVMPDLSGVELAERLRTLRPGLRVLTMSGYAEELHERPDPLGRRESFLQKPFTPDQLAQAVRTALGAE